MIDQSKIGKVIGVGGEHIIKDYGNRQVIKIPAGLRFQLNPKNFRRVVPRDYFLAQKYFRDWLVPAQIVFGQKRYFIIQDKILARPLTLQQLKKYPRLKKQFLAIISANDQLIKEHQLSWDFYGAMGLLKPVFNTLTNLVVLGDGLKMIDFGMMYLKPKNQSVIVWLITRWAFRRQNKFLGRVQEKLKI